MSSGPPPPYAENPPYPPADPYKNQGYPPNAPYGPQNPGYPPSGVAGYPPPGSTYPQPGYPAGAPPPPGFQTPYQPPQQQQQQQVIVIGTQPVATGNCPVCRNGNIVEEFSCCGICLAIFFFPLGLICCLLMRDRRCTRCGARS